MKKLFLMMSLALLTSNAFAFDANTSQVEITGPSARNLYFSLEEMGADRGVHTRRITEYTLGNVYCYSETNVATTKTYFSCTITLTK